LREVYIGIAKRVLEEGSDFFGLFAVSLAEEDLFELIGGVVHLICF
jgi:hypothetical protein